MRLVVGRLYKSKYNSDHLYKVVEVQGEPPVVKLLVCNLDGTPTEDITRYYRAELHGVLREVEDGPS